MGYSQNSNVIWYQTDKDGFPKRLKAFKKLTLGTQDEKIAVNTLFSAV
jgi:hypothetical protein